MGVSLEIEHHYKTRERKGGASTLEKKWWHEK